MKSNLNYLEINYIFINNSLKIIDNKLKYQSNWNVEKDSSYYQVSWDFTMMPWIIWLIFVVSLQPIVVLWNLYTWTIGNYSSSHLNYPLTNTCLRTYRLNCYNNIIFLRLTNIPICKFINDDNILRSNGRFHWSSLSIANREKIFINRIVCSNDRNNSKKFFKGRPGRLHND